MAAAKANPTTAAINNVPQPLCGDSPTPRGNPGTAGIDLQQISFEGSARQGQNKTNFILSSYQETNAASILSENRRRVISSSVYKTVQN
ncbi:MAG: hypothetical protein ABFC77_08505 [Thermoguttaceae bacterium]